MANVYYNSDCDESLLKSKTIAVIGFGSQGHAQAQNMKDSGFKVIIGLKETSKSVEDAKSKGFEVYSVSEASKKADIIHILTPDTIQSDIYESEIKSNLEAGNTLSFSHGFSIHYDLIKVPDNIDVIMIAPKGPGHLVRRVYTEGGGVPALIAVYQDKTGDAKKKALAMAAAVGAGRAGIIETSFKEETETDLFGEQAVLCGALAEVIQCGFETLTEAGYDPEIAYFECLHEMKLITDLVYEGGLSRMRYSISDTAEYGSYVSGKRIINKDAKERMKEVLADIQKDKGGVFAKNWMKEKENSYKGFEKMRADAAEHPIEGVGQKLRKMMKWLSK